MDKEEITKATAEAFRAGLPTAEVTTSEAYNISVKTENNVLWDFFYMKSKQTWKDECTGIAGRCLSEDRKARAVVKKDGSIDFTKVIQHIQDSDAAVRQRKETSKLMAEKLEARRQFLLDSCPEFLNIEEQEGGDFIVTHEDSVCVVIPNGECMKMVIPEPSEVEMVRVKVGNRYVITPDPDCNGLTVEIRANKKTLWDMVSLAMSTSYYYKYFNTRAQETKEGSNND